MTKLILGNSKIGNNSWLPLTTNNQHRKNSSLTRCSEKITRNDSLNKCLVDILDSVKATCYDYTKSIIVQSVKQNMDASQVIIYLAKGSARCCVAQRVHASNVSYFYIMRTSSVHPRVVLKCTDVDCKAQQPHWNAVNQHFATVLVQILDEILEL
jgi:hypothetical protein